MGNKDWAKQEIRDFLMNRRSRISPEDAGLRAYAANRRVEGLRREEVATLAGVSVEYYVRLERGNVRGVSDSVLDAVAGVLQLNRIEQEHLRRLVGMLNKPRLESGKGPGGGGTREPVRPGLQVFVDAITELPTFVFNRRLDIVACNRLGRLLYAPMFAHQRDAATVNTARFAFLAGQQARTFWPKWTELVDNAVALLRVEAARDPYNSELIHLVGELSTQSEEFRTRWADHNVREHESGIKTLCHPLIGTLTMPFEHFIVTGNEDLICMTYTPPEGSPAREALKVLASWGDHETPAVTGAPSGASEELSKEHAPSPRGTGPTRGARD